MQTLRKLMREQHKDLSVLGKDLEALKTQLLYTDLLAKRVYRRNEVIQEHLNSIKTN